MVIDFTNLNDVYHLAMIIVGVGALVLATVAIGIWIGKLNRQNKLLKQKRRKK